MILFFYNCSGGVSIKTLIKNGVIVNYDSTIKGHILVENGVIKRIFSKEYEGLNNDFEELLKKSYDDLLGECEVIDAEGNFIFPGFIDAHTHPGLPEDLGFYKETDDFYTETKAALIGGTTTIVDFAEQEKGQRLIDALNKRKKRYEGKANCKYAFHVAITEVQDDLYNQLVEIKNEGVNSVKLYTTYGMKLGNDHILKVMDCCSKLNMVVLVHCEEDSIINYCKDNLNYSKQRPWQAEQTMVNTIINFSRLTDCTCYICHVSSKESAHAIKNAKEQGVKVYMETCPQYLILNSDKYSTPSAEMTKFILSPPLREKEDNEALIKACLEGITDVISTDHCAFLYKEHKEKYFKDLNKAAKGIPGIQLRVSLIYDLLVEKYGLNPKDLVKLLSYNPAKILSLEDRGYIKEGNSADIVIWEREKFKVTMDIIKEGTDYSPYEGMELTGRPKYVFINGQAIKG